MTQQNKPRKRTARGAGLTEQRVRSSRVNYSYVYTEKRRRNLKPIAGVIIAALVIALGAYGVSTFGGPGGSAQNPNAQQQASSQAGQQPGAVTDNGANANASAQSQTEHTSDAQSAADANAKDADAQSAQASKGASTGKATASSGNESAASDSESGGMTQATVIDRNNGNNDLGGDSGSVAGSTTTSSDADGISAGSSSSSSSSGKKSSSAKKSGSASAKSEGKLSSYYANLDSSSDELKSFVDDTYNAHLYSKLSQRKADYKKFKKLKKRLIADLTKASGEWNIESVKASGKLSKAKKNLIKASDLLKQRLQIIENGYKAINALGKNASKKKIDTANNEACADSGATYQQFLKLMKKAGKQLG